MNAYILSVICKLLAKLLPVTTTHTESEAQLLLLINWQFLSLLIVHCLNGMFGMPVRRTAPGPR